MKRTDILLVEDIEEDAVLIARALAKGGFQGAVISVQDGLDAVQLLRNVANSRDGDGEIGLPLMMVLDLKMRGSNGFEVLGWIRKEPLFHELVVIVVSGSHNQADVTRAYELGARAYMLKPIKPEDLRQLLQAVSQKPPGDSLKTAQLAGVLRPAD